MLTSVQLRQRALRRKREAIHSGERRRDEPDTFWDELFRVTGQPSPSDYDAPPQRPSAEASLQ